jgi:hypothetical protein
MSRRFERLVDPCGNWTVWDGQGDIPATYQGQVLSGLTANKETYCPAQYHA